MKSEVIPYMVPVGTKVKLNKDVSGHNWNTGDVVEVSYYYGGLFYECKKDGCDYTQSIMRNQFYHKDPVSS